MVPYRLLHSVYRHQQQEHWPQVLFCMMSQIATATSGCKGRARPVVSGDMGLNLRNDRGVTSQDCVQALGSLLRVGVV